MSPATLLHTDHAAQKRVQAPIDAVWAEVGSLAMALSGAPGVTSYELSQDNTHAAFTANLSWGPMRWRIDGQATVVASDRPNRFRWHAEAPRFPFEVTGEVELTPISQDETVLDYRFTSSMPRRSGMHDRVWKVLAAAFEDHVQEFSRRVARLAEQHALAEQRLGTDRSREP